MEYNSPYANLPTSIFQPSQTRSAISSQVGKLGQQFSPRMAMKNQASNRGISGNIAAALSSQGTGLAARKLSPLAQAFQDDAANASYNLQRQSAAENDGIQSLGRYNSATNTNNDPSFGIAMQQAKMPMMNNLLSMLFGG